MFYKNNIKILDYLIVTRSHWGTYAYKVLSKKFNCKVVVIDEPKTIYYKLDDNNYYHQNGSFDKTNLKFIKDQLDLIDPLYVSGLNSISVNSSSNILKINDEFYYCKKIIFVDIRDFEWLSKYHSISFYTHGISNDSLNKVYINKIKYENGKLVITKKINEGTIEAISGTDASPTPNEFMIFIEPCLLKQSLNPEKEMKNEIDSLCE